MVCIFRVRTEYGEILRSFHKEVSFLEMNFNQQCNRKFLSAKVLSLETRLSICSAIQLIGFYIIRILLKDIFKQYIKGGKRRWCI